MPILVCCKECKRSGDSLWECEGCGKIFCTKHISTVKTHLGPEEGLCKECADWEAQLTADMRENDMHVESELLEEIFDKSKNNNADSSDSAKIDNVGSGGVVGRPAESGS